MASREFTLHRSWARQATIGFLGATTPSIWSAFLAAFEQRLRELDWINGSNIAIDYRWAEGRQDRYARFAQDFVRRNVDVIVTSGTAPAMAAKKATSAIPIIFAAAGDPVRTKLVASLARPGRNVTGMSNGQTDLAPERLDQLRKLVPGLRRLAIMGNRGSRNIPLEMDRIQRRARSLRIETYICDVRRATQIAPAINRLQGQVDALFVCTDPFITTNQIAIKSSAASVKLATMHAFRDYVETGGLCPTDRTSGRCFNARPISWTRFCVGYSRPIFRSSCRKGTNSLLTRTPRPRLASPYQGESVVARR